MIEEQDIQEQIRVLNEQLEEKRKKKEEEKKKMEEQQNSSVYKNLPETNKITGIETELAVMKEKMAVLENKIETHCHCFRCRKLMPNDERTGDQVCFVCKGSDQPWIKK